MVTYNLHPFDIDKRWLVLFVAVIYLVRYAAVTGVMATAVRWLEGDKHPLLNHNHVDLVVSSLAGGGALLRVSWVGLVHAGGASGGRVGGQQPGGADDEAGAVHDLDLRLPAPPPLDSPRGAE